MPRPTAREREKAGFALLLSFAAGSLDAIGSLVALGVLVAHMTGNGVAGSIAFTQGNWTEVGRRLVPVPLFLAGIFVGGTVVEAGIRAGRSRTLSLMLAVEALFVLIFMGYRAALPSADGLRSVPAWQFYLLIAFPAVAMGMQNMAIRRADGRTVHTTYITGALTNAAEEGVTFIFWFRGKTRGRPRARRLKVLRIAHRHPSFGRFVLFGGIVVTYIAGALAGAGLEQRWQTAALALPLAGLTAVIAWDLARPVYVPPPPAPLPPEHD